MSSGRARDILYGRRGGGWVDEPRRRPPAAPVPEAHPTQPAPAAVEPATLFDPDVDDPAHQKTGPSESGNGSGPAVVAPSTSAGPRSRSGALPARVVLARVVLDPEVLFAPETIAARRAHAAQCRGGHEAGEPCPAVIDPEDLAAVRAGRARMARARRDAGVALTAGDRAALAWQDGQGPGR